MDASFIHKMASDAARSHMIKIGAGEWAESQQTVYPARTGRTDPSKRVYPNRKEAPWKATDERLPQAEPGKALVPQGNKPAEPAFRHPMQDLLDDYTKNTAQHGKDVALGMAEGQNPHWAEMLQKRELMKQHAGGKLNGPGQEWTRAMMEGERGLEQGHFGSTQYAQQDAMNKQFPQNAKPDILDTPAPHVAEPVVNADPIHAPEPAAPHVAEPAVHTPGVGAAASAAEHAIPTPKPGMLGRAGKGLMGALNHPVGRLGAQVGGGLAVGYGLHALAKHLMGGGNKEKQSMDMTFTGRLARDLAEKQALGWGGAYGGGMGPGGHGYGPMEFAQGPGGYRRMGMNPAFYAASQAHAFQPETEDVTGSGAYQDYSKMLGGLDTSRQQIQQNRQQQLGYLDRGTQLNLDAAGADAAWKGSGVFGWLADQFGASGAHQEALRTAAQRDAYQAAIAKQQGLLGQNEQDFKSHENEAKTEAAKAKGMWQEREGVGASQQSAYRDQQLGANRSNLARLGVNASGPATQNRFQGAGANYQFGGKASPTPQAAPPQPKPLPQPQMQPKPVPGQTKISSWMDKVAYTAARQLLSK